MRGYLIDHYLKDVPAELGGAEGARAIMLTPEAQLKENAPEPKLDSNDLLIDVRAAGLNFFDALRSSGPVRAPADRLRIARQVSDAAAIPVGAGRRVCGRRRQVVADSEGLPVSSGRSGVRRIAGRLCGARGLRLASTARDPREPIVRASGRSVHYVR